MDEKVWQIEWWWINWNLLYVRTYILPHAIRMSLQMGKYMVTLCKKVIVVSWCMKDGNFILQVCA